MDVAVMFTYGGYGDNGKESGNDYNGIYGV